MSDPVARLNAALEGRYAIERELGEGGMATVYLADDLKHERKVALKVLKPELAAVVGAERFLAEIKTTANLKHPHILPLFDSGEADSFLFYVMPYMEGETLRDRIDREKQLPVDEAVAIASKVAGALQHAHEHGVIHRDIKPANILLQDGEPVVADFGIALALGVAGGTRLTVLEQDVGGLDVAMDHLVAMCIVEGVGHARGDTHRLVYRKLFLAVDSIAEGLALDIGHYVEEEPVCFPGIEKRQDVRVLEVRCGLDLAKEALGADDGGQLGSQDLEGHLALMFDVIGQGRPWPCRPHRAHARSCSGPRGPR